MSNRERVRALALAGLCVGCGSPHGFGPGMMFRRKCFACKVETTRRMKEARRANPIPKAVRDAVIARDGCVCVYCGVLVGKFTLELDHRVALSQGGKSTVQNLCVSCRTCNRSKHTRARPHAREGSVCYGE